MTCRKSKKDEYYGTKSYKLQNLVINGFRGDNIEGTPISIDQSEKTYLRNICLTNIHPPGQRVAANSLANAVGFNISQLSSDDLELLHSLLQIVRSEATRADKVSTIEKHPFVERFNFFFDLAAKGSSVGNFVLRLFGI